MVFSADAEYKVSISTVLPNRTCTETNKADGVLSEIFTIVLPRVPPLSAYEKNVALLSLPIPHSLYLSDATCSVCHRELHLRPSY